MKRVEVTWLDSCVLGRWVTPDDVKGSAAASCTTIGYLVDENPAALTVAQSIGTGEDGGDEYGQPLVIPRVALCAVLELGPLELDTIKESSF